MERRIGGVSHGVSGSVCVFSKGDKKAPEKFNGVWRTAEISCCWKNYSIDKKGNREKGEDYVQPPGSVLPLEGGSALTAVLSSGRHPRSASRSRE